jgi:hypothetical protein
MSSTCLRSHPAAGDEGGGGGGPGGACGGVMGSPAAGAIDEKLDGVVIIDAVGSILMTNKVRVCLYVCVCDWSGALCAHRLA